MGRGVSEEEFVKKAWLQLVFVLSLSLFERGDIQDFSPIIERVEATPGIRTSLAFTAPFMCGP